MRDTLAAIQHNDCDCCGDHLATRVFRYEGKRYCSAACFEQGTTTQIGRPLFETKPFPPGMAFFRARAR